MIRGGTNRGYFRSLTQNQKGRGSICATNGKKWSGKNFESKNLNLVNPPRVKVAIPINSYLFL